MNIVDIEFKERVLTLREFLEWLPSCYISSEPVVPVDYVIKTGIPVIYCQHTEEGGIKALFNGGMLLHSLKSRMDILKEIEDYAMYNSMGRLEVKVRIALPSMDTSETGELVAELLLLANRY